MANYDKGETTDREKLAAKRQKDIAKYNANSLSDVATYNKKSANNLAGWQSNQNRDIAKTNAARTTNIAEYDAGSTRDQFNQQVANYNFANRQNASLRDTQFKQANRKSESERFEAQRQLQNAALGLFGSMNQAMNGSTIGNAMRMLENRNDADNSTYWQGLQDNLNAIQNAYDESYNQNQVAKRDAAVNALKAIRDQQSGLSSDLNNIQNDLTSNLVNIRGDLLANLSNITGDYYANRNNIYGDLAANLNNINPNLYEAPKQFSLPKSGYEIGKSNGTISAMGSGSNSSGLYRAPGSNSQMSAYEKQISDKLGSISEHNAKLLNYIMPQNAEQAVRGNRNVLRSGDYYSRLINGFN